MNRVIAEDGGTVVTSANAYSRQIVTLPTGETAVVVAVVQDYKKVTYRYAGEGWSVFERTYSDSGRQTF